MSWLDEVGHAAGNQSKGFFSSGAGTTKEGTNAIAPALDFLTKLTKGDQGDVTQAAQPEIDQITQQFDAIRNMVSLQPRGGGKASVLAESPFQKAGAIQRTEGQMRAGAAGQLGTLGSNLAGIGLSESGLGAQEQSVEANAAAQHKNTFQKIMEGISSVTGVVGDIAGLGGALKLLGGGGGHGGGSGGGEFNSSFSNVQMPLNTRNNQISSLL